MISNTTASVFSSHRGTAKQVSNSMKIYMKVTWTWSPRKPCWQNTDTFPRIQVIRCQPYWTSSTAISMLTGSKKSLKMNDSSTQTLVLVHWWKLQCADKYSSNIVTIQNRKCITHYSTNDTNYFSYFGETENVSPLMYSDCIHIHKCCKMPRQLSVWSFFRNPPANLRQKIYLRDHVCQHNVICKRKRRFSGLWSWKWCQNKHQNWSQEGRQCNQAQQKQSRAAWHRGCWWRTLRVRKKKE